jgi:hypothetical protein
MSMTDAQSMQPAVLSAALDYARKGIPVFPCNIAKKPLTEHGFKDATTDENRIRTWWDEHPNAIIGVPTGEASGWAVIDLDHKPNKFGQMRDGTAALLDLTSGQLPPDTVEAKTPSGGRHIFLRHRPGFKCSTDNELGIDVRADGGYVCVPPSPGYRFINPPGLFEIAEAPDFLVDILTKGTKRRLHDDHAKTPALAPRLPSSDDTNPDDVRSVLNEYWNPDDYDDWSTAALALHSLADGYAIWSQWAAKSPKFNASENMRKWNQSVPSRGISARSILARAPRDRLSDLSRARLPSLDMPMINGHLPRSGAPIAPFAAPISAEPAPTVAISSPWDRDVALIPAREWIIRGLMIRNHISILVAPGGSGKSLLSAQWAIALALGLPWGGWTPLKAEKVLLINAEDDGDEMMRRIYSACQVMGVNPRDLIGRLFIADDPRSIVVAKTTKEKLVVATPLADAIRQTMDEQGIGVVIVDPFAETFEGDENSNSEVKWAASIWRQVARDTHASVMLVHHTPKYAKGMAGDADAARGAGALVNSARIVSTLFTMSEDEARLFDLKPDEAHRYVRFDDAKANLTLITGKARWFEKVSHELPNGDSVGVLKPWKPPGVFDGVSVETINEILQTIDAGREGGKYLYNVMAGPEATPAWGGSVIMDAIGCDRKRAARFMGEWLQSGLLLKAEYTAEHRKTKTGLRVDFSKRPGVE